MTHRFFEKVLEIRHEELARGPAAVGSFPDHDFLLNPRRLRGSDFLMRWLQGRWAEDRIIAAVESTGRYVAVAYGPSSAAPEPAKNPRAFERYFDDLEAANPAALKRPDLLIVKVESFRRIRNQLQGVGGAPRRYPKLPFVSESKLAFLLDKVKLAVECENSLWICRKMPQFDATLRPMRRLGGRLGLPKNAVLPTVIVKDEDRKRLRTWQRRHGIPIHVWHVFYDLGYGVSFEEVERLIRRHDIGPRKQTYYSANGQSQEKITFNIPYYKAYPLCESVKKSKPEAGHVVDPNGHLLPFVRFMGGKFRLLPEALKVLGRVSRG